MRRGLTGKWISQSIGGRDFESFLPMDLPPNPILEKNENLISALVDASASVSRMDGAAGQLPDPSLFLYSYIRKEAVLSSQIEGTQSSLSDLLIHEVETEPGVPVDDVEEVVRYIAALEMGLKKIIDGEKINLDLALNLHKILLSSGRGSDKEPGEIRKNQNWIGGQTPDRAKFVPPAASDVEPLLKKLFLFLENSKEPTLIKAALFHLQFETIHPFRDGNGRVGRLLIPLILCKYKLIQDPLIYLSLYFKENRIEYYEQLQDVRINGDWEKWLIFFLNGVKQISDAAYELTKNISQLFIKDALKIRQNSQKKYASTSELYRLIQKNPIISIPKALIILENKISKPTLYSAAKELEKLGIISKIDTKNKSQLYAYTEYIRMLK